MSPCQPASTNSERRRRRSRRASGASPAGAKPTASKPSRSASSPRLSSAAIAGDARIGQPQALGRLAGLPEYVDRHAAARVPVAADPEPARRQYLGQALADRERAGLMEVGVIAEAAEIKLQRLAFDQLGARRVVDHEMGE